MMASSLNDENDSCPRLVKATADSSVAADLAVQLIDYTVSRFAQRSGYRLLAVS